MSRRWKPAEVKPREPLLLSAAIAIFAGIVAFIGTREWALSLVLLGAVFVVSVVAFATILLSLPSDDTPERREELFIPVLNRNDGVVPDPLAPDRTDLEEDTDSSDATTSDPSDSSSDDPGQETGGSAR